MNTIKPIQQNGIYRVFPVNLFGNRMQNEGNKLDSKYFASQSNYTPNHPKVIGSDTQARFLDLLA